MLLPWRSQREGLTPAYTVSGSGNNRTVTWNRNANGYRLPTEAEWEYACRAGTTTAFNTGASINNNTGWYPGNSGGTTHPVGQKPANAWGLYDMHGNVFEWCWDWITVDYGYGPVHNQIVVRGGSYASDVGTARSAFRSVRNLIPQWYDIGFRVVRNAQ